MSRTVPLALLIGAAAAAAGCGAIAGLVGPKIASVTVLAPAGLLVGETGQATANAVGDDGKTHNGRPVTWTSSDPAALSVDGQGKLTARIAGRTVTITAEVEGTSGSAMVVVASDDSRFAFALADQPTAAGTYVPADGDRYNSTGGSIQITRTETGVYGVRFEGMGRTPGQRDNVQVSGLNPTVPVSCKSGLWDASGPDLDVTVRCFSPNGTPTDSKFTILALGAWAFGQTAPLGFVVSPADTGAVLLDTAATSRNSTGGSVAVGRVAEGAFATQFAGLESAWATAPAAIAVSPMGGPRRCRLIATDPSTAGMGINCTKPGTAPGDAPFSLLWLQHGRPAMRFGFASPEQQSRTTDYTPDPAYRINSTGGSVTARKTGPGHYHVVFAGLGRPAGATETVLVEPFIANDVVCDIYAWGNTGANDLFVDVACYTASSMPVDTRFAVLVAQ